MIDPDYVVPEGMLKAAGAGSGGCDPCGFYLVGPLNAALQWLAAHPIVPTPAQALELRLLAINVSRNYDTDKITAASCRAVATEWMRLAFLAPKPGVATIVDEEKERYREALEKLARRGNGDRWGNSEGNSIAQEALMGRKFESEPGIPEEIKDLLDIWIDPMQPEKATDINRRVLEAYRRGRKSAGIRS